MSKLTQVAAVAASLVTTTLAPAALADIQDFYIRNNGGNAVHHIYISPASTTDWEEDVLGDDVMDPYSELRINMQGYGGSECIFDVKIIDENGYEREYWDINLCEMLYVDFP